MFTEKQRASVIKAATYCETLTPDERLALATLVPKTVEDASHIVSLIFAVAYRKGTALDGLYGQAYNDKRLALANELSSIIHEYAP